MSRIHPKLIRRLPKTYPLKPFRGLSSHLTVAIFILRLVVPFCQELYFKLMDKLWINILGPYNNSDYSLPRNPTEMSAIGTIFGIIS